MDWLKSLGIGALVSVAVLGLALVSGGALKVPNKGLQLTDWYALATAHNGMNSYSTQTVVAVGTTQATAVQTTSPLVFINTSSASTGIALPQCSTNSGSIVHVTNASGQTITVYGKSGTSDTINATAGSTGVTMVTNTAKLFVCSIAAKWGSQ